MSRKKDDVEFELGRLFTKLGSASYQKMMIEADITIMKQELDKLNAEYMLIVGEETK